ncbi:putative toxin-antitoxin system toxin component, PIN family [Adhaeribacter rhizoryzae]|uniref:Putative toxin-antitoxin system toxin component, PIN family n=1 Tax=Adhaeribacter rhizoryzae TaxID=2607907 RepID=A0A5M6DF53_9BACT|nr:putative toxin-antitoxin system toxin component, PIN family [Adhaeribacter rhizoryzae]KAA5545026.1 putative toxin-antitoxin system toxin component, PIN family [Adhaeribacter rhizoryzae]
MLNPRKIKVIFDTNIWISFLIGKRLTSLKQYISTGFIQIILTEQLIMEIELVTQRPKLQKYFNQELVQELLSLLVTIGKVYKIKPKYSLSRDAKDNFLLDLIDRSKADYLVTGDNDLLDLGKFGTAIILTPKKFEEVLQ